MGKKSIEKQEQLKLKRKEDQKNKRQIKKELKNWIGLRE